MRRRNPRDFTSSAARPAGFERFWADTLAGLESAPPNVSLIRDDMRSDPGVDVFDVRYDSYGGLRIAGWYARPAGEQTGLPGLLIVPGYVSEPKLPKDWARRGYAAFSAAPRGKLRSNSVFNPGYPGLLTHNVTNRDEYAYRGFYMDAVRAFDILSDLPEVDASRVGVAGSSQGGALTLLVSALRGDRVAAASAGAPYLCSFMDAASLTHSYPYQEINEYLRLYPECEPEMRAVLDFYDIQNFAPMVQSPIIVNIGLQDDVCPPETGFAVFEQIGSDDKKLYPYDGCAHDSGSRVGHEEIVEKFLASRLKPEPVTPVIGDTAAPGPAPAMDATDAESVEFAAYWDAVDRSVRELPVAQAGAGMSEMPLRSTDGSTTYGVALPAVGGGEVFGYFSVPQGEGPFPALLEAPGYGSVVHISPFERRQKYVVLTLVHRGQRLADGSYAAAFPGMLTDGISDPDGYIYRGIVADVLTGLDFLAGRPEVDPARLGVAGSELGLMAAARRGSAVRATLVTAPLILCAAANRKGAHAEYPPAEYPLEEIDDYLRAHPGEAGGVTRTLARFDPLAFAPGLTGELMVACPADSEAIAARLVAAAGGGDSLYLNTGRGHMDHEHTEAWLDARLSG